MKETACQFGPKENLFGILTQPEEGNAVHGAPIAVVLNAGIVHRIGPFRLHVKLARQLAERGFTTLRMDLSGLGDSQARPGKIESTQSRAVLDVADALDYLTEQTGTDRFVVLGLCSGAFNAHQVAVQDSRIVGSVFLDGIVFRTVGFYIRHHVLRMFSFRFWRNFFKRRFFKTAPSNEAEGSSLAESEFFGEDLDRDSVIKDLKGMLNRGVRMLFLYTDGYDDICGRTQFKEMYGLQPDDNALQVEYYPKSEHTFRLIENREAACNRVANWFEGQFQADGVTTS